MQEHTPGKPWPPVPLTLRGSSEALCLSVLLLACRQVLFHQLNNAPWVVGAVLMTGSECEGLRTTNASGTCIECPRNNHSYIYPRQGSVPGLLTMFLTPFFCVWQSAQQGKSAKSAGMQMHGLGLCVGRAGPQLLSACLALCVSSHDIRVPAPPLFHTVGCAVHLGSFKILLCTDRQVRCLPVSSLSSASVFPLPTTVSLYFLVLAAQSSVKSWVGIAGLNVLVIPKALGSQTLTNGFVDAL